MIRANVKTLPYGSVILILGINSHTDPSQRNVTIEEGQDLARSRRVPYLEVCGDNLNSFYRLLSFCANKSALESLIHRHMEEILGPNRPDKIESHGNLEATAAQFLKVAATRSVTERIEDFFASLFG